MSIERSIRMALIDEYGGRCFYCGIEIYVANLGPRSDSMFNVDHKIPKSRGGTNKKDNLVCSCRKCNYSKGTLTVEEFRAKKQRQKDPQIEAMKLLKKALRLSPDLLSSDEIQAQVWLIEDREYPWFSFYGEDVDALNEVSA